MRSPHFSSGTPITAHGVDLGADAVARGLGFVESMPGTWKASLTVDL